MARPRSSAAAPTPATRTSRRPSRCGDHPSPFGHPRTPHTPTTISVPCRAGPYYTKFSTHLPTNPSQPTQPTPHNQPTAPQEDTSASGRPVKYVVHTFSQGAGCHLTQSPRTAEVRYTCLRDTKENLIVSVREFPTCNYVVLVTTPLLCQHAAFKPPVSTAVGFFGLIRSGGRGWWGSGCVWAGVSFEGGGGAAASTALPPLSPRSPSAPAITLAIARGLEAAVVRPCRVPQGRQ
jgi:hypothetical protein